FARQFLSESFTWLDHLIFACVPLGILTAITGAIRVQGPKIARSFIGRARENRAAAEIELMSSTSQEVCEMFNGKGIVRTMGRPTIAQIIIFPDQYDRLKESSDPDETDLSCGIYTLQTAVDIENKTPGVMIYKGKVICNGEKARMPESVDNQNRHSSFDFIGAPNLQLNVSSGQSSRQKKAGELFAAAVVAVVLQLSLLIIAAVTVYHEPTKASIGYDPPPYGFPCFVAGSVLLFIGMGICSFAIESSTVEFMWKRNNKKHDVKIVPDARPTPKSMVGQYPRLIWLQQSQRVNDQAFGAYAILGGSKRYILTSSRQEDVENTPDLVLAEDRKTEAIVKKYTITTWEALTIIGVFAGALGFITQFVGLRGLSWPCSVSQLLAIFVMALVRALIRRRLGKSPLAYPALAKYELDFLATQIVFSDTFREFEKATKENKHLAEDEQPKDVCSRWKVVTAEPNKTDRFPLPGASNATPTEDSTAVAVIKPVRGETSQQLVRVRERLGDLCKWTNSASQVALTLAQSIERFMEAFFPDGGNGAKGSSSSLPSEWTIEASHARPSWTDKVTISVERRQEGREYRWFVEIGKIEALLSLWLASIESEMIKQTDELGDWRRSKVGIGAKLDYCRIIGDNYSDDVLKRDISWWVSEQAVDQANSNPGATLIRGGEKVKLVIGFNGPVQVQAERKKMNREELSIVASAYLPTILAQHIFTSFIWSVARNMPRDCLRQSTADVKVEAGTFTPDALKDTWYSPKLSHARLDGFVKHVETAGLGSRSEILLCIIPALSFNDLLPNERILSLMPREAPRIVGHGWARTASFYHDLLECSFGSEIEEYFALAAVTTTMEFVHLACEPYSKDTIAPDKELDRELRKLVDLLKDKFLNILIKLMPAFDLQKRREDFQDVFRRYQSGSGNIEDGEEELVVVNDEDGNTDVRNADIFGWTALHYAATGSNPTTLMGVLQQARDDPQPIHEWKDRFKRSPIHVAALCGNVESLKAMLDELKKKKVEPSSAIQAGGLDGMTPIHLAVKKGHQKCVDVLLGFHKPYEVDVWGRGPIHLAAITRDLAIAKKLLDNDSKPDQADKFGRTPLAYLSNNDGSLRGGEHQQEMAEAFMGVWKNFDAKDDNGQTVLHHAVEFLNEEKIENLYLKRDNNIDIQDRGGRTTLHAAIINNRTAIAFILVEMGANMYIKDNDGRHALLHAAASDRSDRPIDNASFLWLALEKMKGEINTPDNSKCTPLHAAILADKDYNAVFLLTSGADAGTMDASGNTPLTMACRAGNCLKTIEHIVRHCSSDLPSWDVVDDEGLNPIDFALQNISDSNRIELLLLRPRTSISVRIKAMKTLATRDPGAQASTITNILKSIDDKKLPTSDFEEVMRLLLPALQTNETLLNVWIARLRNPRMERWADMRLPLHLLAQYGQVKTVASLVDKVENPLAVDEDGWTYIDVAEKYGYPALKDELAKVLPNTKSSRPSTYRTPSTFPSPPTGCGVTLSQTCGEHGASTHSCEGTIGNRDTTSPLNYRICLRVKECIPPTATSFYYEVHILTHDEGRYFAIGFSQAEVPNDRYLGFFTGSWGYHADDGDLYFSPPEGVDSSGARLESNHPEKYRAGDVVGCGLNMLTGEGYRTRNGERLDSGLCDTVCFCKSRCWCTLGDVFREHKYKKGKIYPCVGFPVDVAFGIVHVRVVLRPSEAHRFHYLGPYE
ncbi:hypothetical protein B0H66DRAFT_484763, partial [Apodospora peruviana]